MREVVYNEIALSVADIVAFDSFSFMSCTFKLPSNKNFEIDSVYCFPSVVSAGIVDGFTPERWSVSLQPTSNVVDQSRTLDVSMNSGNLEAVKTEPVLFVTAPGVQSFKHKGQGFNDWTVVFSVCHQEFLETSLSNGDAITVYARIVIGYKV